MRHGNPIKAFYEIDSYEFTRQLSEKIKNEIEGKGKEYILGVDDEKFKKYLIDKYTLEPLVVDFKSEKIDEPTVSKELLEDSFFKGKYEAEVYTFTVRYSFTGSAVLFKVKPNPWSMTTVEIYVNEQNMAVSFSFRLSKKDPVEFNSTKKDFFNRAFANLNNTNGNAISWNNDLKETVNSYFQSQKNKFQKENDFFTAINVKGNKDTAPVFTVPTIKKKIIPQPAVSQNKKNKDLPSNPIMDEEIYKSILEEIYILGKNMEKKPSTYQNRDEEGLRDQFLLILENRYESTTASGETFNRGGNTDIMLKYAKDGSNLFVAECKFWHGSSEFLKGISQLFDRYLTWRDSKVALLLFVKNKDFTNVLQTIKTEISNHPYFIKGNGGRGETSYSYIFHLPQDEKKPVYFEVIAFHFDR